MIVTNVTSPVRTLGAPGESIQWRSLARRGMLHSECESFDHVRLTPDTEFALRGRYATEQVWFVLRGTGEVTSGPGYATGHPVREGDLLLAPDGGDQLVLHAGLAGVDVLWLTVLPSALTATLPGRKPVIS
ncbi:MAG TPA: cupin domain-containing protein [Pseudonocardiaceae bacterium]|nr:cupin domain-containing protein [Pseudonocardiaceae bacterium]